MGCTRRRSGRRGRREGKGQEAARSWEGSRALGGHESRMGVFSPYRFRDDTGISGHEWGEYRKYSLTLQVSSLIDL
jgi:hypothetical protein